MTLSEITSMAISNASMAWDQRQDYDSLDHSYSAYLRNVLDTLMENKVTSYTDIILAIDIYNIRFLDIV